MESILKAKNEDIDSILKLEEELFIDPYNKENINYELNENPFSKVLVYKNDKDLLGYIIFWITFDSATICKIGVNKNYQKLGIGSKLLTESEKIIKEVGAEFYTLEVRESNINAIKFYEKNGFKKITTKKNYYSNGENALYYMKGEI